MRSTHILPMIFIVCLASLSTHLPAAPAPTDEYLKELQTQKATNKNPTLDLGSLKINLGMTRLSGLAMDLPGCRWKSSSPAPASMEIEVKRVDVGGSFIVARVGDEEWKLDLGFCPSGHPRKDVQYCFFDRFGKTDFELGMIEPITDKTNTGFEAWAEKPAKNSRETYRALRLVFGKQGKPILAVSYSCNDSDRKQTLNMFFLDYRTSFGLAVPGKGRYELKSGAGKTCLVEIGDCFGQLPNQIVVSSKIDGKEIFLRASQVLPKEHHGHDLAKEGAPKRDMGSSFEGTSVGGVPELGIPGVMPKKNRNVLLAVDSLGKPVFLSCYSKVIGRTSYDLFLAR